MLHLVLAACLLHGHVDAFMGSSMGRTTTGRSKGACTMQRQVSKSTHHSSFIHSCIPSTHPPTQSPIQKTREVEVYDPSSYTSILKNQPVEWFDNTMSYGVFNWGLSSTGVRKKSHPPTHLCIHTESKISSSHPPIKHLIIHPPTHPPTFPIGHATRAPQGAPLPPEYSGYTRGDQTTPCLRAPVSSDVPGRVQRRKSPTHPPTHPPTHLLPSPPNRPVQFKLKQSSSHLPTHPPTHPPTHLSIIGHGAQPHLWVGVYRGQRLGQSGLFDAGLSMLYFLHPSIHSCLSPTHPPTHPPLYRLRCCSTRTNAPTDS